MPLPSLDFVSLPISFICILTYSNQSLTPPSKLFFLQGPHNLVFINVWLYNEFEVVRDKKAKGNFKAISTRIFKNSLTLITFPLTPLSYNQGTFWGKSKNLLISCKKSQRFWMTPFRLCQGPCHGLRCPRRPRAAPGPTEEWSVAASAPWTAAGRASPPPVLLGPPCP